MSDLIRIVDLEVWAHIGVPDEERAEPQKLLMTLDLWVESITRAAAMDDITRTVDYYQVTARIKALVIERQRKLLETLAEEIAADLLRTYRLQKMTIEIMKFVLPDTSYVSVKIDRERGVGRASSRAPTDQSPRPTVG
jgi:dihydroneopterin aldolase